MTLNNEITARSGSKDDLVKVHLDTKGFTVKPGNKNGGSVGSIVWRTSRNIKSMTKEEFVRYISNGYAFIPGICPVEEGREKGGSRQKDWEQQDVFLLDFDNEDVKNKKGEVTKKIEYITLEDAVCKLKNAGLEIFIAYRTFSDGKISDGKSIEKFRIGVVATDTITDRDLRDKFQATFMGIVGTHIDESCSNRNRYFNGTSKDRVVYVDYEAKVDVQAFVDEYWCKEYVQYSPKDAIVKQKKVIRNERKEKEKGYYKEVAERCCDLREPTPVEEFPDVFPEVHDGLIRYNMQHHCEEYLELVEKALEETEYVEGTGRRSVMFDVFNMISFKEGTRKAYEKCLEINQRFKEPLSVKEFNACTWNALNHIEENCDYIHETQFVYRYDTLLDRLGVTDEVKEEVNYFKYKREKERADMFRPLKRERDAFICELRNAGMGAKKIRKELIKRYGEESELVLSMEGVKWILKNRIQKGGSFGTITFYNNYSPLNNNQLSTSNNASVLSEEAEFDHTEDLAPLCEDSYSTLNEGQERAFNDALKGYNLFVTGGAGTGKSYLVKNTIERLRLNGKSVAVCAASALAASAYEDGMTFHRLFGFKSNGIIFSQVLERISEYDAIIIEEVGMLGKSAMDYLGTVMYSLTMQYGKTPQIILVGDVLQLPPIEKRYFFESEWYKCFNFVPHYLIENIRQRGAEAFFRCLNDLRLGVRNPKEINRICQHNEVPDEIYLMSTNPKAEAKNMECLERAEGELIDLGNGQFVKIGAKVICNKNRYKEGVLQYYNGLQGTVFRVSPQRKVVTIRDSKGNLVRISRCEIEEDGRIINKFPFLLGYAITIHKSQGMTLECANIDPKAFAGGQLYVALSRVKTAEGVNLLHNVKASHIKELNSDALEFDEDLRAQCGIKTIVEEVEYNNERE